MANDDVINGFLGEIGFGFSKIVDKVKETATKVSEGAKELSPQYQVAKTAMSQFKGSDTKTVQTTTPSGRTISRRIPVSSGTAIPTTKSTYKKKEGIVSVVSKMLRRKIFKIPVGFWIGGLVVGVPMVRKAMRK
ncbi:MAG: hypothetical protein AABW67_02470 [Nanoarchaeota archaeon]